MNPRDLILSARALRSEEGDNPEYDRALVELVTDVLGGDDTLRLLVDHDALRELVQDAVLIGPVR